MTMGSAESSDIALWTQKIAEINPSAKITLHGVSMGAATAMLAAANSNLTNVTSLVEDCGYTNVMNLVDLAKELYPALEDSEFVNVLDKVSESLTGHYLHEAVPLDSIGSATMPSMFITGTSDTVIPPSMLETLYAASGAEVKEIFTVEGAGHALSAITDSIGYSNAVFRFNAEAAEEGWITSNVTDNISLRGTKYDDTITNSGSGVTLNTGAGDDTITNNSREVVYQYTAGDGNDVIIGVTSSDTIVIESDTYKTLTSGNDKVISIVSSSNTITLKDATNVMPIISGIEYMLYVDKEGNTIDNPVAIIASGNDTYYYESVARAANDADENSAVTVIADSTETATINSDKGLTIQFAESGLGVYSVSGGNFLSADNSVAAQISISASKVLSNSNSLLINNGATSTLDGYVVTGTANGYTFALKEDALTFDSISYSGAGSATFDTLGKISLTSGAIVEGTNDITSSTGINLAAGDYTINAASITASAVKTIYANSENVQFQLASDTLNYNDMVFSGNGYATIAEDLPTLTAGVNASRPERIMAVLTEQGQNTLDGRGFWVTENITDGVTVGAIDNGIGAAHIVSAEDFPEDAGKLFAEEALIYGDSDYTLRVDHEGIRSIFGISDGATLRGNAYLEGEIDTLGSILQFGLDGAGVYQLGNKAYTVAGSAINDSVVIGMTSRFYNDGTSSLRAVQYFNGTVSGDFSDGVSVNGSSAGVEVDGDTNINVIVEESGVKEINGISNGASIFSGGGATKVSTDEEGFFSFRDNRNDPVAVTLQNFTVSGDDSVDFILRNYNDASGNPTMQVEGINNFENGTLRIDEGTKYTGINVGENISASDEFEMEFIGNVTFTIADSKVVSIDGINYKINNISGDVNVHASQAITVNNVYANVVGDEDFNVIVEEGHTKGLANISAGATVSMDSKEVTTDNNGEFTFMSDHYTIEDSDGSVTFITGYNGKVENIKNFEGTLKSSAQSVTVNGAAFSTTNTDTAIISEGVGISRIENLSSGDTISGSLDTTTILIPAANETDTAIITVNSIGYTLASDSDGVEITGKRMDGLDNQASLMVGAAGTYTVNNTELTAQIGNIFIGTAEGSAYIYDPNNLPLDTDEMTDEEIAKQSGINATYTGVETNTMITNQLVANGGSALNGSMELLIDNSDKINEQTADFSNATGKKKVTLAGGDQAVKFNNEGGNIAVIESDSIGEKNVTLGSGGDLVIVRETSAEINIYAGSGKDTIVTAGKDVLVNMSSGGATKIVPNSGNVILEDYNASTGAGVQLNDAADLQKAITNGIITLGSGKITFNGMTIDIGDDDAESTTINLFNNKGVNQKVVYTHDNGGTADASGELENLFMLANSGVKSSLIAGSGNDTAIGSAGDYFDLGAGNNYVALQKPTSYHEEGATIALTATRGQTEVDGFNFGYDDTSDKVKLDIDAAQISYKDGQLTFSVGDSKLILNNDISSSADLIDDNNFVGDTTLDEISPITYEQGEIYNTTARDTLSSEVQITFAYN